MASTSIPREGVAGAGRVLTAFATLVVAAAWLGGATTTLAAPLPQEKVLELCAQVESPGHCGRRIETEQLKTLPNLAVRDGDVLRVSLFPSGTRDFADTIVNGNARGFAVWDYWNNVNAVVLFITDGERIGYGVLQRANGKLAEVPAEPILAPDRQHFAVADVCSKDCTNELSVWRIARDGIRKTASFAPPAGWKDVTVAWKDGETLTVEATPAGEATPRSVTRRLDAADWKR